jgi:mono/diheme cytochrome c family protein
MRPRFLPLPLALALALGATVARPQDDPDTGDGDAANGQALYMAHCASCHGMEARGNGPEAPSLNPQPKDLTRLAAEEGGVFPVLRVVMRIDGREPLVAHGSPMPVFGEFFDGEGAAVKTDAGQPILTSKPVVDLVTWLEGIQVEE